MTRLVILGAGGHGKVAADCAQLTERYQEIVFVDAKPDLKKVNHWAVVGQPDNIMALNNENTEFFVAIGHNATRKRCQLALKRDGATLAVLIHPDASLGQGVKVGEGTLVLAKTAINIDTRIGKGCIVNTGATIDHDCDIADFVHVAPGCHLAGDVTLGQQVFIGVGGSIIPGIEIGSETVVGAGATVVQDIPSNVTVVGTPAKEIS